MTNFIYCLVHCEYKDCKLVNVIEVQKNHYSRLNSVRNIEIIKCVLSYQISIVGYIELLFLVFFYLNFFYEQTSYQVTTLIGTVYFVHYKYRVDYYFSQ